MLKKLQLMKIVKFTVITKKKKGLLELPPITEPQFTKILNVSKKNSPKMELGMSFIPTPKQNIPELENDIFQFTKKLRLTHHYRKSNTVDESIV